MAETFQRQVSASLVPGPQSLAVRQLSLPRALGHCCLCCPPRRKHVVLNPARMSWYCSSHILSLAAWQNFARSPSVEALQWLWNIRGMQHIFAMVKTQIHAAYNNMGVMPKGAQVGRKGLRMKTNLMHFYAFFWGWDSLTPARVCVEQSIYVRLVISDLPTCRPVY